MSQCYRQKTAGIKMTFFGFSPRRGETLHLLESYLARRSGPSTYRKNPKILIFRPPQSIFLKFAQFMCCYSPHRHLKFAKIWFINQGFVTEKTARRSFLHKLLGPLAQKLEIGSQNNCLRKNGTKFSIHMPSLVEIGLRSVTRERK